MRIRNKLSIANIRRTDYDADVTRSQGFPETWPTNCVPVPIFIANFRTAMHILWHRCCHCTIRIASIRQDPRQRRNAGVVPGRLRRFCEKRLGAKFAFNSVYCFATQLRFAPFQFWIVTTGTIVRFNTVEITLAPFEHLNHDSPMYLFHVLLLETASIECIIRYLFAALYFGTASRLFANHRN